VVKVHIITRLRCFIQKSAGYFPTEKVKTKPEEDEFSLRDFKKDTSMA
jgi:hypothetical protein